MKNRLVKIKHKIEDRMLLRALSDGVKLKTIYRDSKLSFLYNVMVGQKHRMLFYKRLKKKYLKPCTAQRPWEQAEKTANKKVVWFCWLQGLETAPELVKRCLASLREQLPDKEIRVLDKNNLSDYISLPDYIVEKWEKGIISPAHFSDLVRLELLIKYGGYWIDATVFCTDGSITEQIDELPLFMYSFYYFGFNPEIMETNNWFIYSTTNQNILCLTRAFLHAYWKEKNRAVHYFIFHLFMTIALEYYEEEYKRMPIVSQVDAHILATYIFEPFDELKFDLVKRSTGFHKLSTRFDPEGMKKQGTFYEYLIKGENNVW